MTKQSSVHITVPGDTYGTGWNGNNQVPTKNDVYDKIESIPKITVGTSAPGSPSVGDLWVDTN